MKALRALAAAWRQAPGRWLVLAGCLLLAATFLKPHLQLMQPRYRLFLVLDVSQSMNATDVALQGEPVSRVEFARHLLREALRELPCGSQAGLGLFTEYRTFLLLEPVEVCANYSELASTLDRLDYRMAWAGGSEISKGVFFALRIAGALDPPASLVFFTDGHEAPPLHPQLRPQYDGKPGEVRGVLVGVGGDTPVPIPKFGPDGKPLGYWKADEVLQTDVYSRGRGGSVAGETMVDQESAPPTDGAPAATEHLSSLKEAHLKRLAEELGLAYYRLQSTSGLLAAIDRADLAQEVKAPVDLRGVFALAALGALALMFLLRARRPTMQ
ncbi:MAG: VWA domain-containing protein [Burkholderiales bacterium]